MSEHAVDPQVAGESTTTSQHWEVRRLDYDAPLLWLAAGVRDLVAAPYSSVLYGMLFAASAAATTYAAMEQPGFAVAFITGLLLIGPVLAAGLYVAARQRQAGEKVSIVKGIALLARRSTNIALFAVFLALLMAAWVRLSALIFALQFNTFTITLDGYQGVLSGTGDPIVVAYFVVIGLLLAAAVFVTSAVAVPMIVDRDCGPLTAIHASVQSFAKNWLVMLGWAASIVALTVVGVATLFLGMIILFPVLGYASWHSYKGLIAYTEHDPD